MMLFKKLTASYLLLALLAIASLLGLEYFRSDISWARDAQHEVQAEPAEHGAHGGPAAQGSHEEAGHGAPSEHGSSDAHGAPGSHGGGHAEEVAGPVTPEISPWGNLPFIIALIPMLGALGTLIIGDRDKYRNILVVTTTVSTLALVAAMWVPVVSGIHAGGKLYKGIYCHLPFMPGFDLTFNVDPAGLVVAVVTAFLWVLSTIYATSYMTIEEDHVRYDFCVLATLTADLGVLMAGDFLTLFIFFEGLIIFPYSLVAHKGLKECIRGANMYLYLGVVTGLSLLAGILLFWGHTGSVMIKPVAESVAFSLSSSTKYLITILMVIGFGGKAGLFFEHIWLPNAHPVAPTPASCLLSGAMIKCGAYGIFRVACLLFLPAGSGAAYLKQWITMYNVGYAIIWVGTVTMFLAVCSALITANSKRMLAFHSVSQMGYIILGVGCAAYMGRDGAMGLAGAMYHIVNHALFKASLFLCVGAVYFRTHQLDMYELGGLWRNMPVMAVGLFIAVCGISGIPGFNGFASKTVLHHAILEAYDHSAHYLGGVKDFKLKIAEIIFMLTAGGTFASNIKLFMLTFMGERKEKYAHVKPAPISMKISIALVSFAILYIGLFPNWLLETFIGPALSYFGYDPSSHAYHMLYNIHVATGHSTIPLLYPMTSYVEQMGEVLHNLLGGGTAVMLGGMYFVPGMRFGWFHTEVPTKLQIEYYYVRIFRAFKWICFHPISAVAEMLARVIPVLFTRTMSPMCAPISKFASWVDHLVPALLTDIWLPLVTPITKLSSWIDNLIPAFLTDIWLPLSKPISKLSAFVDEFITGALTDTWLPLANPISKLSKAISNAIERLIPIKTEPTAGVSPETGDAAARQEPAPAHATAHAAPAHTAIDKVPEGARFSFKFERPRPKNENPWQLIVARIYLIFSGLAAKFDFKIVDGFVNGISKTVHGISRLSQSFDTHVIDKIVDGTAKTVEQSSNLFKRIQTGRMQNYLFAVLLGMLAIITMYLLGVLQ